MLSNSVALGSASQMINALSQKDPVKLGSALKQIRQLCAIRPLPKFMIEYLDKEPTIISLFNVLNFAQESSSIQLSANCLYTFGIFISTFSNLLQESEKKLSLSPIFGNIFDQHSKTIHRCFGPGRTEATVACLSFLIVCISCDGGSCAQIVLNSLRWDHKTVARLLSTRSPSSSNSTTKPVMNPTLYYVPEIRSLMIRLIFTAISTTDLRPSVKLDFWRTKGLAYGVLKGLQKDSYCSLAFILDRLWQGVVVKEGWNARWGSKSAFEGTDYHSRWEIFDRTTLTMLIQLLDREDVHSSLKSEGSTPEEAGELMERFLTNLIIYVAKLAPTNVFQSQANLRFSHYRLLSNLIRVCAPTKSLRRQRLALHALQLNPSLFGTLWRHSAPPTEVSPTISWISSVGFATKVITIPVTIPVIPLNFDTVDREKHNLIKTSAEDLITLCIPSPLTRLWLTKTLQHSNALISFTALGMLVACLKKAIDISSQLRKVIRKRDISHSIKPWSGILAAFSLGLQAILPVPQVLVAALQTALRRAQESKLTSTLPAETNLEPSNFTSFSSAADSDIVSFQLLSALGLYQELFPKLMCNVGFDYAKLVPIFLKVKVTDDYCEPSVDETLTRKVNSAVFYLCQSQVLKLISHSASSIPPSQTLIKFLLSLSSTPHACKPLEGLYTPYPIKKAAIEALEAITKYNVPHLESVYESHELVIWIDCLTELRGVGEDKWHLMIFLEDCIRALLRDPLKFVQATQESFKLNPLSTYGVKVPLLLISFLLKLSAVVKALSCDPTNEKRIKLVQTVIKFLNFHTLATLSSPHKLRPLHLINYFSSYLDKTLEFTSKNQDSKYDEYPQRIAPILLDLIKALNHPGKKIVSPLGVNTILSLYSQSRFSSLCKALQSMSVIALKFNQNLIPKEKRKVSFAECCLKDSEIEASSSLQPIGNFQKRSLDTIRFIIRPFESELFSQSCGETTKQEKSSKKIYSDLPTFSEDDSAVRTRGLMDLAVDCLDHNPKLIESLLKDDTVWFLATNLIDRDKHILPFLLRSTFPYLDKSNPDHVLLATRYANLLVSSAAESFSGLRDEKILPDFLMRMATCATSLFSFLVPADQAKMLATLLSATHRKSWEDKDYSTLLLNLINTLLKSSGEGILDILCILHSPSTLQALKNLSQLSNGEGIVDLILLLSNNLGHLQSLSDDDDGRLLSVWEDLGKEILGTGPDKLNLADKTLRIVANLIKKSPEMLIAALEWLSKSSLKTLCSSLWGSSYLLAACLQVSNLKDSHSDHNSSRFKEILDRDRVKAFLSELLSSAFPDKISNSQSGSKQLREQRSSAQNALEQVFYSEFDLDLNQLFLRLARVTESNLVYAEALSVMCTTQSSQLKSYIEKCLRWLVRRFAEDDSISLETEELSLSLSKCLGRKGHQILLPVHLVNPVVSVALERWLNVGFVMKLINQLIRSTKLEDSEVLKHLRAVVERRKFRTIMESFDDDQQDVSVISVLKSLVLACPLAAVQVNISSLLIPFYGGTVSMRDTLIFQILRIEDLWSTNFQLYQTILEWKPRRLSRKAIRGSDPFAFLDSDRLDATCIWILSETSKAQHSLYDPTFLLMFFLQFSEHEKISISIWNSVAGVGLLGMMMCGLSSSNKTWRVLSDRCLAKSYELLKDLNHADASEILLPLEHFRRLHGANRLKAVSNAVPPLITLFLARCSKVLSAAPGSELCPLLSRFLLQRAIVDARDVPMLYGLLYSTTDRPIKNRVWLMELLRDGFNSTIDWKIMDQRQTIEILSTLVLLSSRDESDLLRPLFLQILERLCSHNQPFIKTFTKSSMAMVLREIQPRSKSEYEEMVKILFKAVSRLPLLPRMVSSEVTKDILIIIESLTEAINQSQSCFCFQRPEESLPFEEHA
ncbi:ribosome 60S biogenesis N-terminal-domain-containing protein [Phakopsora pachyrhizi]|uniref:Ribosome 60S biogenesis N-terminal-domain-containing protein n=1 Tax=Phakopsora pachyrhizi TaxID=170000 RepID=A0AAV0ARR8_PHAPC|nr:ribosome 60S biogenesis N-terminal-domain-containing protein [Phakopsora pachyrhizi]